MFVPRVGAEGHYRRTVPVNDARRLIYLAFACVGYCQRESISDRSQANVLAIVSEVSTRSP